MDGRARMRVLDYRYECDIFKQRNERLVLPLRLKTDTWRALSLYPNQSHSRLQILYGVVVEQCRDDEMTLAHVQPETEL